MKKIALIGIALCLVALVWFGSVKWLTTENTTRAQNSDSDTEYRALLERDKNVPREKIEKAYAEAKKISDDVVRVLAEKKPKYTIYKKIAGHLRSSNPGRLGETRDEITWKSPKNRLFVNISLGFNNEETTALFQRSMEGISMGEFFPANEISAGAILVKNVQYNQKTTQVSLHFVKGRAKVAIYVGNNNSKRKTAENEKELMEIARLIEPLIVARANFDD